MPGFFDVFFRPAQPKHELPKTKNPTKAKKVKKVKKATKTMKKEDSVIGSLRSEIAELREMVTAPEPEPEPEPVVEAEEPEDDESS